MNLSLCAVLRCTDPPYIDHPLNLCRRHALAVSLNVTDRLHANALNGTTTTGLDIEQALTASPDVWTQTSHPPVVYFLTNGDRVKIGTSTNIVARISALSLRRSNAALLLQGGSDLEHALHRHFECDRIARTEWFVLSPQIQDFIARRKKSDAALHQPGLPPEKDAATVATENSTAMHVTIPAPKGPTAEERILAVLRKAHSDGVRQYVSRADLGRLTGVNGSTLDNTLSNLRRKQLIRSGPQRGTYALGRLPDPGE